MFLLKASEELFVNAEDIRIVRFLHCSAGLHVELKTNSHFTVPADYSREFLIGLQSINANKSLVNIDSDYTDHLNMVSNQLSER
jgi:hypothetical protein